MAADPQPASLPGPSMSIGTGVGSAEASGEGSAPAATVSGTGPHSSSQAVLKKSWFAPWTATWSSGSVRRVFRASS